MHNLTETAKKLGLVLLVAGCNILPDEIEIKTDQDLEKPDFYQIRVATIFTGEDVTLGAVPGEGDGAIQRWAVYGPDSTETPLATGTMDMEQTYRVADITQLIAEAAEPKVFTVVGWNDLDGDGAVHPLEPFGQLEVTIGTETPGLQEFDTSGNVLSVHEVNVATAGRGGPGSPEAPIVLETNKWLSVEMFSGGVAPIVFDVDVAGDYLLVADVNTVTGINTTIADFEMGISSLAVAQAVAVGQYKGNLLFGAGSSTFELGEARVLLMRLPAEGDNAAHLVVGDEQFGRNGLDIFPFVSVVTYETSGAGWLAGQEINFSRTKEGDELNNPVAQFLNYANNFSSRTLNYTAPSGQVFSGFNDNGDCQLFGGVEGFSDTDLEFDDGDGPYTDASAMIASCTVGGGGNEFNVTAAFRR